MANPPDPRIQQASPKEPIPPKRRSAVWLAQMDLINGPSEADFIRELAPRLGFKPQQ